MTELSHWTPKQYLDSQRANLETDRITYGLPFYSRLVDSIYHNRFTTLGVWGESGVGKSELVKQISTKLFGSKQYAQKYKITNKLELPDLIKEAERDKGLWIPFQGQTLKRIWCLWYDEAGSDTSSSESSFSRILKFWNKYRPTLRTHVAVMILSFIEFDDYNKRSRQAINGEIACRLVPMKNARGRTVYIPYGEAMWNVNLPNYYKKGKAKETKTQSIPFYWKRPAQEDFAIEFKERSELAERYLKDFIKAELGKAKVYVGLAGKPDEALPKFVLELLGVIKLACHNKGGSVCTITDVKKKQRLALNEVWMEALLEKTLRELKDKQIIGWREIPNTGGQIWLKQMGDEMIRLWEENEESVLPIPRAPEIGKDAPKLTLAGVPKRSGQYGNQDYPS